MDLHHSGEYETVISIPELVTETLPNIGDNTRGQFQVLYYSDNIVACVYKSACLEPAAWLIVFDIETRQILTTKGLESAYKIFVRHNNEFLYYGTHSEIGTDGFRKWVIHGYDFKHMKWLEHKLHLSELVGSEIGSSICFELHNGYFYALSNQTSFEVEEIDWTSFYHCVRFPLASPRREYIEKTEDESMWRRQHQEGPIDDRWTSLRLDIDEITGDLKIIECRREWRQGSSRSRRTCYTTDIIFPRSPDEVDLYIASSSSSSLSSSTASATTAIGSPKALAHDLSSFPDEPILRLLGPEDNPHHMPPPPRLPQFTHPENDGSGQPTFPITDSPLRYYNTSASTFLDLVDDPLPSSQRTQRLRIRSGSRKLGPPLLQSPSHFRRPGLLRDPPSDLSTALKDMYSDQPIRYWPPAQNTLHPNKEVDALYTLLNPPTHLGNVDGTADERSLLYVTGGYEEPQAIVFVAFDPAIKLAGLKRWGGIKEGVRQKSPSRASHIDEWAISVHNNGGCQTLSNNVDEADRVISVKRSGKDKARANHRSYVTFSSFDESEDVQDINEPPLSRVGKCNWARLERAMYRDIGIGYYFGLERSSEI